MVESLTLRWSKVSIAKKDDLFSSEPYLVTGLVNTAGTDVGHSGRHFDVMERYVVEVRFCWFQRAWRNCREIIDCNGGEERTARDHAMQIVLKERDRT